MDVQGPTEIAEVSPVEVGAPDDALILAASWEERCLGLGEKLRRYRCQTVILTVYDGKSKLRERHIEVLRPVLRSVGHLEELPALHSNPLPNVRATIRLLRTIAGVRCPRLTIDVSTFTRKHLLQLLHGLDYVGMLKACQLIYTEPQDYHTEDDEPVAKGISAIEAIATFAGSNRPSRQTLLVVFLGYEGRRTLSLWENLEPNATVAVIPEPPYHDEWRGRTEMQNRYLLSCLPKENVYRSHSLRPADTDRLLTELLQSGRYPLDRFNYRIAPLGTRAQLLGVYRFWRCHPELATMVYARPVRYREEQSGFPAARTWVLDRPSEWPTGQLRAGSPGA